MIPKIWIYAGILSLAGAIFWLGKLQERSVNAPAVAAAQAKYDALSGEKKSLLQESEKTAQESKTLRKQLRESESQRTALKTKVDKIPKLLGVVGGKPVIGYEEHASSSTYAETEKRRQEAFKTWSAKRADSKKASNLQANRKAWHFGYLGIGWQAAEWDSAEGWKEGVPVAAVGINVQPFTLTGRKAFDGNKKLEAELGFNW